MKNEELKMSNKKPFFIFRFSFFSILVCCTVLAFADDDFNLPDDVQKAEVPTSVEDIADAPVNFAPIEATTTSESVSQVKPETPTQTEKPKVPQAENDKAEQIRNDEDKPAAFKAHQIPEDLNRPLRVGIFTGVKELYFKFQGETVHVTATKNKVKFEAGGNATEDISREFNSEDNGCLAIAPDTRTLGKACYPGSIMFRNTNGKLDAINSVDVEDYLRGVVPYEIGKLDSSRIEALKAQAVAART